jgi:hypothetical protein
MITKPTVLILGAGASTHLGYPLGAGLIAEICKGISNGKYHHPEIIADYPKSKLDEFRIHLSRSGYPSIDTFLEHNTDYVDLGKMLITLCLKQYEEEDRLFSPNDSGWYLDLFQSLIKDTTLEYISNTPLTIVTFNYDRSLEAFLHKSLIYRYHLNSDAANNILQQIKILHPHGIIGKYPDIPYKSSLDDIPLSDISKNIIIIHELKGWFQQSNAAHFRSKDFTGCSVSEATTRTFV